MCRYRCAQAQVVSSTCRVHSCCAHSSRLSREYGSTPPPPPRARGLAEDPTPRTHAPVRGVQGGRGPACMDPTSTPGPEWTASSPPHSLPSSWASFQTSSRVHSSSENSLTRQQELLLPSSSFWTFPAPLSHTHLLATCDDAGVPPGWGQTHIHTPGSPFQPELGTYYMLVRSRYGDTCHCTFQKKLFGSSSETVPPFFR